MGERNMDPAAYQRGRVAFEHGLGRDDNPEEPASLAFYSWHAGWISARWGQRIMRKADAIRRARGRA